MGKHTVEEHRIIRSEHTEKKMESFDDEEKDAFHKSREELTPRGLTGALFAQAHSK